MIFIFEGSDGKGTDAHPLWGPRAPSSGGLGGRPFSALHAARLTRSLPLKRKSRQSAAVVGMSWGRVSPTGTSDGIAPRRFSFSRGRTGKGLTLTCSGALVHRPRQDWADGPSQRSTRLDSPARSLENRKWQQSAAVQGLRWGRPQNPRCHRVNTHKTESISRGSDREGADARPLWGRRPRFWAGPCGLPFSALDSPARSPGKSKWWQSAAVLGPRRGRLPLLGTSVGIVPQQSSISRGSHREGADAHPLWGPRVMFLGRAVRTALLGARRSSTHPLAPSKTKVAAERCRSGTELGTCPPDWNERRNRSPTIFIFEGSDGEGTDARPLWDPRGMFLGRTCGRPFSALDVARLTSSLPRKSKSRRRAGVLGPRCGRVPLTGTSDGIAPRRFSFSRGRTGKGLTLARSGALVQVSGQNVRTALPGARLARRLAPLESQSRGRALPFRDRGGNISPSWGHVWESLSSKVLFRGVPRGKGLPLTSLGQCCNSRGGACRRPFSPSYRPLAPSKIRNCERALPFWDRGGDMCPSSEHVWESLCSKVLFRGVPTEKGPSLTCPGAVLQLSRGNVPSALLPLVSPARCLENRSRSGGLPFRQRTGEVCPRPGRVGWAPSQAVCGGWERKVPTLPSAHRYTPRGVRTSVRTCVPRHTQWTSRGGGASPPPDSRLRGIHFRPE